jgi:signal transduction histidine kinase
MRSLAARIRTYDPAVVDAVVALLLAVECVVEIFVLVPGHPADRTLAIVLVVAIAACFAVRRRWPLASSIVAWTAFALVDVLPKTYSDHLAGPFFAIIFLAYSAGRHLGDGRVAVAFVYGCGSVLLTQEMTDGSLANNVTSLAFAVLAPMLIGRFMRHRAGLHRTLEDKAARLAAQRRVQAEAAAADERTRIAGELHDVVAHALSAMVVQGAAARRLAVRDPERASDAFAAVETTGREALTEIRSLLGVLRREDEELALAPQPSLRHVSSLIARMRAAGLPVELAVEGVEVPLPAGIDVTAYRVVQEALRSALEQGAAGHAEVRLTYAADHVDLRIDDDGGEPARALPGVRERVSLHGGQLRAGARRLGGHGVRARLPLGGSA